MAIDPDKQLPGGADTVNEAFFDALIRHQIGLMRLSGSVRNDVIRILNATEQDIADQIRAKLARHKGLTTPADTRRLDSLLRAIRAIRLPAWQTATGEWLAQMRELAKAEPAIVDASLKTVVPVTLETTLPPPSLLSSIVSTDPFEGRVLRGHTANLTRADMRRISDQIKIGMVQGQSAQAIARRVVGTAAARGRDGALQTTRRQIEAVVRTGIIHISNQAKRAYYQANANIFTEEVYTATLDSRTTPICRSLDGEIFPVGEGPIPPLHFNCRSVRVAVIDGEVIGTRPARPFTERQLVGEFTRREGIARVGSRDALPRGFKGRFDDFKSVRVRELTGRVPAKVNYQQWLTRQSVGFQNDVLGSTRGRLFRKGGLTLDQFVNRRGDEIPLRDLARFNEQAFVKAGLDPSEFTGMRPRSSAPPPT